MTRKDILLAVKHFLDVVDARIAVADRERALRAALDPLALASHFAEAPFDDAESPDAPELDYQVLRASIEPLFPGLGLYNEALNIADSVGESALSLGDALDDLTDITRDLRDVLFYWEHTSEENALWHLRFGFESHWGQHLRSLQLYLHARTTGR
ncbi:DUF5063 domain-containing protein [Corallococcus sp. H22C18031201]|nr:DUF5063 domain-containing protein [Corallococcus sp. H22C18031201]